MHFPQRQKDQYMKNYICQSDGTYSTPVSGDGGRGWPQCTTQPVDPRKAFYLSMTLRHVKLKLPRGLLKQQKLSKGPQKWEKS